MNEIKVMVCVSKLSWRELWDLWFRSGASPFGLLWIGQAKMFGLSSLDRELEMNLELRPISLADLSPEIRSDSEPVRSFLEKLGFEFIFADFPTRSEDKYTLYFQNKEIVLQVICLGDGRIPVHGLVTVLRSGSILATANNISGISNGGATSIQVVRNATVEELLRKHRARYSFSQSTVLQKNQMVSFFQKLSVKVYEFNVGRGVYKPIPNSYEIGKGGNVSGEDQSS